MIIWRNFWMGRVSFISQSHLLIFTLENIDETMKTPEQIIILESLVLEDEDTDQVDWDRQVKSTFYWIKSCQTFWYLEVGFHLFL